MPRILLIGTLDTKLDEYLYLRKQIYELAGPPTKKPLEVILIDCGQTEIRHPFITISQAEIVSRYGSKENRPATMQGGEKIQYMIDCTTDFVKNYMKTHCVHAIMGAGGSGGTSMISAVMRQVAPCGMPKLIVSTVASGDTAPIVVETDMTLMHSVVDIAGTNSMLKDVLRNAAGAILGMSLAYEGTLARKVEEAAEYYRPTLRIGITMFGVTTPCVDQIRKELKNQPFPHEVYVFHATGKGGLAMERMVEEGRLDAVLDLTTTEICDHLFGGNMSAGPKRLEAALKKNLPYIISLGATDMVNFGGMQTVPVKYKDRKLHQHNNLVTLMRTTKKECEAVGAYIVGKIKSFADATTRNGTPQNLEVWLPRGGVSSMSIAGGPFADKAADDALAETIIEGLKNMKIPVVNDPRDINDPGFASDIAESLIKIIVNADWERALGPKSAKSL